MFEPSWERTQKKEINQKSLDQKEPGWEYGVEIKKIATKNQGTKHKK